MKRKHLILAGTAIAIAGLTLSACSPAASPETTAASQAAEKPTLSLWVNSADSPQLSDLYKKFTAETGYKVDISSFPSDGFEKAVMQRWSTGDRPDILEWHGNFNWVAAVDPAKNMQDLTDKPFVARTLGGILKTNASMNGRVYGAILNTPTSFGLYYNKTILEAAGVTTPPSTAEEVYQACLAIKKAKPDVVPLQESGGSLWTPLVFHGAFMADALQDGFLDRLNKREAKVNDADSPWLGSLEFYTKLLKAGCFNKDITTAKFETSPKLLLDGKAAMVSMHTGFIQMAIDASDLETVNKTVGWTAWSNSRPVVTSETSPIGTYYLPKTGDAAREAGGFAFLDFVTGPAYADYIQASKQVPTLEGVETPEGLPEAWKTIQAAVAKDGAVPPVWAALPGITDLVNYPGRVIVGDLTPKTAVDLLQEQAEQGAAEAGLPAWTS